MLALHDILQWFFDVIVCVSCAALSVEAFDEIISGPLAAFVEKSKGLGAEVAEIVSDPNSSTF